MDQKICLDSDVCIEIIKNTKAGMDFFNSYRDSEAFVSSISVFELLQRGHNLEPVEKLISRTRLLDFDESCARKASEILRDLKKKGKLIDFRDLFIASTAIANDCALATLNRKHFKNIRGLRLSEF